MGRRQQRCLGARSIGAWSFLAEHHEEALPVAPAVAALSWWCPGSRAWHPLAPSWVPLPTPGQVKDTGVRAFRLPLRLWKNSTYFLRAVLRYSHLTLDFISTSSLQLAGTWPGVHAPFYGGFRRNFRCYLRGDCARAVRTWKSGHDFHVPSLAGLFVSNAWHDSGYMRLDSSWRLLDECPVFSTCWGRLGSCGRFTSCSLGCFLACL